MTENEDKGTELEPKDIKTLEQELQDTKDYLAIVMQELEKKQECKLSEPELKAPDRKRKQGTFWKYISLIEFIMITSIAIIIIIYKSQLNSVPVTEAVENQKPQIQETMTNKIDENLSERIKQINITQSQFKAEVVQLDGYEYLCFNHDKYKIYYRNEFEKDATNDRFTILIDNGEKICEFGWDYDLNQSLANLIPYVSSAIETGKDMLIFPLQRQKSTNGEGTEYFEQLKVVEGAGLYEYATMEMEEQLQKAFAVTYEEQPNQQYVMKLKIGNTEYNYEISKDTYVDALYYDVNPLQFKDYFSMEILEEGMELSAVAYLSETEFLGKLLTSIVVKDGQLQLGEVKYGAYVTADQEDEKNNGVIVPRNEIMPEPYLTLWGKNREVFYLEKSKIVELNNLDKENFQFDETGYAYYEDGVKKTKLGIDVSKYQGEVDWNAVKKAGIEYAIIRVGFRGNREGTLEKDPYFETNMKNAAKAGIPVGVYFFSQAIDIGEAYEEAEFVLHLISKYEVAYPVVFDTEQMAAKNARANGLARQLRTDIAKAFCETVKEAGYRPMIYANTKQMIMGIDLEQLTEYDLWFAYYGSNLQFPYQFEMYQFSQEGKVAGIKGAVDLNLCFVDYLGQ